MPRATLTSQPTETSTCIDKKPTSASPLHCTPVGIQLHGDRLVFTLVLAVKAPCLRHRTIDKPADGIVSRLDAANNRTCPASAVAVDAERRDPRTRIRAIVDDCTEDP